MRSIPTDSDDMRDAWSGKDALTAAQAAEAAAEAAAAASAAAQAAAQAAQAAAAAEGTAGRSSDGAANDATDKAAKEILPNLTFDFPDETATPTEADPNNGHHGQVIRKRKRRKHSKKKQRRRRIILIIVLVIVAIVVAVAAAWFGINAHMTGVVHDTNQQAEVTAGESEDKGQTITYQGHKYQLNPNMISILFMGHDDSAETQAAKTDDQADAIAVIAMDTSTGDVTVINVPRDSMVTVDQYGVDDAGNQTNYIGQITEQLCLAYSYGHGAEAVVNVEKAVERTLYNIPITYYIDLDETGIEPISAAIGGVPVTALETIPNTNIVEGESILLNGTNAHKYVQYRNTSDPDSSLDRQARQSQFIKSFMSKTISSATGNLGMLSDLFGLAQQYTTSNLSLESVVYFAQCVINNGVDSPNMVTLSGTSQINDSTGYHEYTLDQDDVTQTVIDTYYTRVD